MGTNKKFSMMFFLTDHEKMRILRVEIQAHHRRLRHANPFGVRRIFQREEANHSIRRWIVKLHCGIQSAIDLGTKRQYECRSFYTEHYYMAYTVRVFFL